MKDNGIRFMCFSAVDKKTNLIVDGKAFRDR